MKAEEQAKTRERAERRLKVRLQRQSAVERKLTEERLRAAAKRKETEARD